jgi:hypothetical protein
MKSDEAMQAIEAELSHIWMVRAFLKHSEEAEEDEELCEVHRGLYDYMLALGKSSKEGDSGAFMKMAVKKFAKLRRSGQLFFEIQPEISSHTNFMMAAKSLKNSLDSLATIIEAFKTEGAV